MTVEAYALKRRRPMIIRLRGELREDESMSRHVSWRAGGAVQRAYFPVDLDDLRAFLGTVKTDEPIHFVGLGSNLLVRDGGLRGTVIFTHRALDAMTLDAAAGEIHAQAGVASPKVARFGAMHDFVGAEFLAGIPGTVGGALAMNAGCYGGETWNIVRRVDVIDRLGRIHTRTPAQYRISYRSVIKCSDAQACELSTYAPVGVRAQAEWFVSAVFALSPGDGAASREQMKALLSRRIASQPLGLPNAGSVFRNPSGAYAAKLIEDCGLKGHVIGGAVISMKHANFIVNTGAASAADIEALINLAQHKVKEKFGVELEREVRIIGDVPSAATDQNRAQTRTRSHGGRN